MSSTALDLVPGAASVALPGDWGIVRADASGTASATYRWQAANGEAAGDHVYVEHKMQTSGSLTTDVSSNAIVGTSEAKATINGSIERAYKSVGPVPQMNQNLPAILLSGNTRTARFFFAPLPTNGKTITALFSASVVNEVDISLLGRTLDDPATGGTKTVYFGSASATASRSASTTGFTATE